MDKLNEYYEKTADSDVHILAMRMSLLMGFVCVFADFIAHSATPCTQDGSLQKTLEHVVTTGGFRVGSECSMS